MEDHLEIMRSAAYEAGRAIVDIRNAGFTVSTKENNDVLTQADLQANKILQSRLLEAYPEYGWLSEESVDNISRLECDRVWVVDPIDGTREFVSGIPEYAVSIALVEDGLVVLAVVYNPETDEMFTALRGRGAFLNGRRIHCKQCCQGQLVLLASRSESKRGEWERFNSEQVKPTGSIAYKLGLVAAGLADATFSLVPKSEWDIAAGVLLVSEAGGVVTDASRHPFVFNQTNVLVNGIVASSSPSARRVMALIAA
jgi:myo-inositol-1(or 4)-monophosphatase